MHRTRGHTHTLSENLDPCRAMHGLSASHFMNSYNQEPSVRLVLFLPGLDVTITTLMRRLRVVF